MDSNTELFKAIENNDLESVKDWLERGANLQARSDYALQWAAGSGKLEIVNHLLERGANPPH